MLIKKGIVLIATGHNYYTHMALNLAVSLRYKSSLPITLFHSGSGIEFLFEDQKSIFDLRELPYECILEKGNVEPYKAKTFIYDLSPYDETLYLDVDMIFSPYKCVDDIFKELKDIQLQFACHGEKNMDQSTFSEWVDLKDVKEKYGFNHWFDVSSEFIYFKKSDEVKKVFDDAKEFYSTHGLQLKQLKREGMQPVTMFQSGTPDELPFSLSLEKNNYCMTSPYFPSYWQPRYFTKTKGDQDIWKEFYLLSAGGAYLQPNVKRMYDNQMKNYFRLMGLTRPPYQLIAKSQIMKERKFI